MMTTYSHYPNRAIPGKIKQIAPLTHDKTSPDDGSYDKPDIANRLREGLNDGRPYRWVLINKAISADA